MPNNIISMPATQRACRSALDEFLPEPVVPHDPQLDHSDLRIDPREIHLEPLETQAHPIETIRAPKATADSKVQVWPMLAAAFVAFGVTLLGLAVFLKYANSAL